MTPPATGPGPDASATYLRRLLVFLCLVAFFDGYDLFAMTQTLPELRRAFGLSPAAGSRLLAAASCGTVAAYLLVRLSDRWGRRPLLIVSLGGYSAASLLSALAPEVLSFLAGQLLVRFFLMSALAMTVLYAVEEYPADRRGRVLGIVQASFSLGAIVCAGVTPPLLGRALGWRLVYLVGAGSAGLLLFAVGRLRETRRFRDRQGPPPPLLPRLPGPPHRRRLLQLSLAWLATFFGNASATAFWKEFAQAERGLDNQRVGAAIALAAVIAVPLTVWLGRLTDRLGRRPGAVVIYLGMAVGWYAAYAPLPARLLVVPLVLVITGATAAVALLNAWTAESFPTELRGDTLGWASNLIGRLGHVLAPLVVAELVGPLGWGRALSRLAVLPLVAMALCLGWLPETAGRELAAAEAGSEPAQGTSGPPPRR